MFENLVGDFDSAARTLDEPSTTGLQWARDCEPSAFEECPWSR
jgi:hypothetical protein